MRTTPIGIAMLNDEREHVWQPEQPGQHGGRRQWADMSCGRLNNADGGAPRSSSRPRSSPASASPRRSASSCAARAASSIIMCYNVWNFPFLAWPFVNCCRPRRARSCRSRTTTASSPATSACWPPTAPCARRACARTASSARSTTGDPAARVVDWVRAAKAVTTIRNEVYGLYGGHSMGMETGYFHLTPTLKTLGCTAYQIDQFWLVKVCRTRWTRPRWRRGRKWFEDLLGDRLLYDGKMLTPETLETQIRLYLAMERVNKDKGFDFCGLKGQRELTEHVCLGDVPEMLMNDPYDWDGPKEPTVCATEADAYAAITMQLLKYISGGLPTLFMDVRLYQPDWACGTGATPATTRAGMRRAAATRRRTSARSPSTRRWSSTSRPAARRSSSTPRRAR